MFVLLFLGAFLVVTLIANNAALDKAREKLLCNWGWLLLAAFAMGVSVDLAGYKDSRVYKEMIALAAGVLLTSPVSIIYTLKTKRKKAKQGMGAPYGSVYSFTASVSQRRKIVSRFNKKYSLMLTEQQIENIINGSLQNEDWAREVMAMDREYESIYEWLAGDTGWLRAYLKSFNVQEVSYDFGFQYKTCLEHFDEVFKAVNIQSLSSVEECIEKINYKFFTNFDEPTFMVAYRFLQANGRRYELPQTDLVQNVSSVDDLLKKYKSGVDASKNQGGI